MDPVTLAIAGVGLVTSFLGKKKEKKAARAQAEADSRRAQIQGSVIGIKNKAFAAEAKLSRDLSALSARQEDLRRKAVVFENAQARRNTIKSAQLARATAISKSSNSGGLNSSGLSGVLGTLNQDAAGQQNDRRFNLGQSFSNFAINESILKAQKANSIAQSGFNNSVASLEQRALGFGVTSAVQGAKADFGRSLFSTGIQIAQGASTTSSVIKSLPGLFK